VSSLAESAAERIVAARQAAPFSSWADFVRRTRFGNPVLSTLAKADAFRSLGLSRREALWRALARRESSPLFDGGEDEAMVALPRMSPQQEVVADYQTGGLSLRSHPLRFLRNRLQQHGIVTASDLATLEPDRRYRVAGLVLMRQRPGTARGITFMTIEDETGTANLIVHRGTWERFHHVARRAGALIARGILQRQHDVIHLLVDRLDDLTAELADVESRSRDFR
jgi:error-prone DNA polymerase